MKNTFYVKNKVLCIAIILFGGFVLGTFMLVLANMLPERSMVDIYHKNSLFFEEKQGWHWLIDGYDTTVIDYNTEIHMMKGCLTPMPPSEENIVQKSLRGYAYNEPGTVHGLKEYHYTKDGEELSCDSYERYWHGYEVILSPLFLIFNYSDLIVINGMLQILLCYLVLRECQKCKKRFLTIAFVGLWIVTMQPVIMLCLDYSVCFYLYMAATLLLLNCPGIRTYYEVFFLVIGMATVYFDFLTWPVITLGVPLIVYLSLEEDKKYKKLVVSSCMWGLGYVGLWMEKWIFGSLILSDNIFKDAVRNLLYRSSSKLDEMEFTWIDVLLRNIAVWFKPAYMLLLAGVIAVIVVKAITMKKRCVEITKNNMLPILFVAVFPIVWICLSKNHAYEHYWMTWRDLGVTVFAGICCVAMMFENRQPGRLQKKDEPVIDEE